MTTFTLSESSGKVRLVDVATLTFHKGKYTTGRRSSPLPQIQCIGGSAKGRFEPKVRSKCDGFFTASSISWCSFLHVKHDCLRSLDEGN